MGSRPRDTWIQGLQLAMRSAANGCGHLDERQSRGSSGDERAITANDRLTHDTTVFNRLHSGPFADAYPGRAS